MNQLATRGPDSALTTMMTVMEFWSLFAAQAGVEEATKKKCRTACRKLAAVCPTVAECNGDGIARFLGLMGGMSPASRRSYFAAASQVFAWAVRRRLLSVNPFVEADRPRAYRPEVATFDSGEIDALCHAAAVQDRRDPAAPLRWLALFLLTGDSALRIGEALNLRWQDLALEVPEPVIHVRFRRDCPGQFWQWGTKGRTDRLAPIGQDLLTCLYRLQLVAPWRYPLLKRVTCLRLQAQVGRIPEHIRKLPAANLYREFRQLRRAAGVKKNGCFHTLRKTAISDWLAAGVPLRDVQDVAGHASVQTTLTAYAAVHRGQAVAHVRARTR